MLLNVENNDFKMTIETEAFFPTSTVRVKRLFKIMRFDRVHDFTPFKEWLKAKAEQYRCKGDEITALLEEHRKKWFENGLWYGACVDNEKKAKAYQKEIKANLKTAEKYEKYITLFNEMID